MTSRVGRNNLSPLATSSLSFVDVFAGCGGLSLGLMRAGWTGKLAIEKDPFAFATLSTNLPTGTAPLAYDWPPAINRQPWDINDFLSQHTNALQDLSGRVDLLAGGPPCQGFSYAGRRRTNDPRNTLFRAYVELVRILRPRFVLLENVRGFRSDFKSQATAATANFAAALARSLESQYDLATAIIRASDFGVPQVRPRFYLVGIHKSADARHLIATFFDDLRSRAPGFLRTHRLPLRPTAWDAIGDLEVTRNGTFPSPDTPRFNAIAYQSPLTSYQHAMRDGHEGPPPDTRLARHRPDIRARFASIIEAAFNEGRLNTTISAETRKRHGLKKMAIRVLDPLGSAPTITSLPDDLLHYFEPRTLTVRENARLQSFPDWFAFQGKYTTGGHRRRKEVPRFTQVANAVPPLLAEQFGLLLRRLARRFPTDRLTERPAHRLQRRPMPPELQTETNHP